MTLESDCTYLPESMCQKSDIQWWFHLGLTSTGYATDEFLHPTGSEEPEYTAKEGSDFHIKKPLLTLLEAVEGCVLTATMEILCVGC